MANNRELLVKVRYTGELGVVVHASTTKSALRKAIAYFRKEFDGNKRPIQGKYLDRTATAGLADVNEVGEGLEYERDPFFKWNLERGIGKAELEEKRKMQYEPEERGEADQELSDGEG